jgi:Na+/alanine symporter
MRVSQSEPKMKSGRRKLWGGVLIGVSFAIGLFILFGLHSIFSNPQNNEPNNVPNLALECGLAGLAIAFLGGLVLRGPQTRISAVSRVIGVLVAAFGIFVGLMAWNWSYFFVPWAWSGYDYFANAIGYWFSIALSLGGGLLFGLKRGSF